MVRQERRRSIIVCMRTSARWLLLFPFAVATVGDAFGQRKTPADGYWGTQEQGWHFYRDPEKPQPQPAPPSPPPPEAPRDIEVIAPPPAAAPAGPKPLSAAWLKENLPRYQMQAIDDPSPQNVELVAYLQRLSMDKAERYSQAMMQVPINNPALDEYARSALSAVQRDQVDKTISEKKRALLAWLSNRFGIWYFFQSTCPYCARQEPILDRVTERTGLSIFPISLDGGPMASGKPDPYVVNAGHAERLGVMTTPTMMLADTATGEVYNLAAGLRTVGDLEDRILELAKQHRWITEAQYDEAMRGEPRMYLTDGNLNLDELQDDPALLLEALKRASYNGGTTPWVVQPQTIQ